MKKLIMRITCTKRCLANYCDDFCSQQSESSSVACRDVQESKSILPQLTFCWWKKVGDWMAMSM